MKKYFLHNGTESSGPFDLEELRIKKITKKTPVWFEGMENWKTAGEIEELKSVFVSTPPPLESFKTIPSKPIVEKKHTQSKILGLSKNVFFIVLVFFLLVIATVIFNNYEESRNQKLKLENHKTEVENHQYELRQKAIEEQKRTQDEQEKKETERVMLEKKQSYSNRLLEIQNLLSITQDNLNNAQKELNAISGFKFLRTAAEKKTQMSSLQNQIDSYKSAIDKLNNESDQLKLELEKTH